MSYEEALALKKRSENILLQNTTVKQGPPQFSVGVKGGEITIAINSDPKTFNTLNARDGDTGTIIGLSFDTLADYDAYKKEFVPNLADFTVRYDESNQITYVTYTLKDNLYWRNGVKEKVRVTADDIIFWREEIQAVQKYNMGYETLFIRTKDGNRKKIEIKKNDDRSVEFAVPAIIANPVYFTNMTFGPKYKYKELLQEAIDKDPSQDKDFRDIFSLDINPKIVPSITGYILDEYQPGRYIRYKNVDDKTFWKKDKKLNALPYIKIITLKIVKSDTTQALLFKQGDLSVVNVFISQLSDMIDVMNEKNQTDDKNGKFVIYNKGPNLGASFISFNQNPASKSYAQKWFVQKKFRQAMSSLLPRQKIADSVYSGLSEPAIYFFAKQNKYFDADIALAYRYNPEHAVRLLKEAGFYYKEDGLLYDKEGVHVEFSFNYGTSVQDSDSVASLFEQELKKVGISLKVKPLDFQLLVEKITKTYQWDVCMVALSSNFFPESGPTIWLSNGITHLWNPAQKKPATEWEKRIDTLYYEGLYTKDGKKRKIIYDEYQKIILEELPLTYITYNYSFSAARKNIENVFMDSFNGSLLSYSNELYIKEQ